MSQIAPSFHTSNFNTEPYIKRVEKPWGYELHWVREDAPYMGKMLHINKGTQLSLQVHDEKEESYFLLSGRGAIIWEDNQGNLIETEMQLRMGYSTQVGQKHRLAGITDCDIIEASTPEKGTTWRLEDDYTRPHETPEQRVRERSE